MLENLNAFTDAISNGVIEYLLAFAAVGALTMAVIQTLKDLTPLRAWFHRRELRRWLSRGTFNPSVPPRRKGNLDEHGDDEEAESGASTSAAFDGIALSHPLRVFTQAAASSTDGHAEFCRKQLIALSTGDAAALYALEIEKLAGQLNAAAVIVADFPRKYPELLRCLARHADQEDVNALIDGNPPTEPAARAAKGHRAKWNEYLERKVRVTHQIQRNIDAFQIATAHRWSWALHLCSFGLSFGIALVAVAHGDTRQGFDSVTFVSALPVALGAGFLAPIARDLLTFFTRR